jgi:hypothetical protein
MDNGNKNHSGSAYWKGFFSVFDLWGAPGNHKPYKYNPDNLSPEELDYQAIERDWEVVGTDLEYAMNQYEQR